MDLNQSFMQKKNNDKFLNVNNIWLKFYIKFTGFIFELFFLNKEKKISNPKSILVCNAAHLGDVLYTFPIIETIKKKYPNSSIDYLCSSDTKNLIILNKNIRRVYVFDHFFINRKNINFFNKFFIFLSQLILLKRKLKKKHYDLALDFYPYYPNYVAYLKFFFNVRTISSFMSSGFYQLSNIFVKLDFNNLHIYEQYVQLFNYSFKEKYTGQLIYRHSYLNIQSVKFKSKKNIIIQPCSGNRKREWSIEKWISLCNKINKIGYNCFFLGKGHREQEIIKSIILQLKNQRLNHNLANNLTFSTYLSYVKNIKYFIGVESFGAHLSHFFGNNPIMIKTGTTIDEVWGLPSKNNIRANTSCYPCFKTNGCKTMECVAKIEIKDVFDKLRGVF